MTVAELIEKLKQFDPELPVVTLDRYADCIYLTKIYVDYDYHTDETVVVIRGDALD